MKYIQIFLVSLLVFGLCSAFSSKKDEPKYVYAFGISASFTDSVVCYTDIQILDSAKLTKEGFLEHHDIYSNQLKNYLEGNQLQQNSTCMIYYSDNKKNIDKEFSKAVNRYKKGKGFDLRRIEPDKFRFTNPGE